ncbi:MAG: peptide chain release factor 2 [Chlamydiales bacterium]|nr:peptide chain release factor 2 [Chlamydiales bacterium]
MRESVQNMIKGIQNRLAICGGIFDLEEKEKKILLLEEKMGDLGFWEDQNLAQKILSEIHDLKAWTIPSWQVKQRFENVYELILEVDQEAEPEFFYELEQELKEVDKQLSDLEIRKMLSGELDKKNCFLTINAGAGGTESCDWVGMLSRMYQRWASKRGWKTEIFDFVDGDVAGLKSITIRLIGSFAYGYAKAERGVHRLVRISPFDSNARRHTSFASVDITPEIDEKMEIEIKEDQLQIETYRASGAGGQHVNKTDSAVRMRYAGITVSCQKERSQVQNRETCLKMLKAKLYEKEYLERKAKLEQISGEKKEIGFGSQIRNYIFQPYTLVKDTRTKYEVGNVQAVLDGEIDGFINAYLQEFG